eukprot:124326-Chlamydomonas_euryale.AAC.1
MRSSAFQTACMREVIRAREQADAMEAQLWEARQAAELVQEQLTAQLAATQTDLEVWAVWGVCAAVWRASVVKRVRRVFRQLVVRWN